MSCKRLQRQYGHLTRLAILLLLFFWQTHQALAHITVWPAQSAPAAYEHYIVYVPSELPGEATTSVRVIIPPGVIVDTVQQQPGWTVKIERQEGHITALNWLGGQIASQQYQTFGFAARNPTSGTVISWAASQTYLDGRTVVWNGAPDSSQPAALTTLSTGGLASTTAASSTPSTLELLTLVLAAAGAICGVTALGILILVLRQRLL